jgi:hypothetical protein
MLVGLRKTKDCCRKDAQLGQVVLIVVLIVDLYPAINQTAAANTTNPIAPFNNKARINCGGS